MTIDEIIKRCSKEKMICNDCGFEYTLTRGNVQFSWEEGITYSDGYEENYSNLCQNCGSDNIRKRD